MKLPADFFEPKEGRPDEFVGLAESGHRGAGHDLRSTRAVGIEDLAVLLGGEEPGANGVDPDMPFIGANSRATFCVRLTTAAFDAE